MTSGAKAQTGVVKTSVVTLSGDATGPSNANTVAKINGSPLGTTTGATTGYVLTWNGSAWVPAAISASSVTMGGDVTGNSATSTVAKIQGSAVAATAPTSNQVLQWNGTAWTPTTLSSAGVTSFNTRTGAVVPANADYLAVASGGLTGATNATRYVGGTTNGSPASGTFAVGDFIVDATASIWVCTTAGTPGTWSSTISNHMTLRSATATAKYNEITLFQGSTASQTISAAASPIDSTTWTIINNSTVPVTAGFSSNAMYPLGSASSVTSLTVAVNAVYSFVNYNGGNWYMVASNNIANLQGTLAVANGGTGLTSLGTAGQVLTVNSGATGLQYSTPTTTTSVTMGGDVTGNSATSTVAKIQGSAVAATAPTSNQVLQWNGTAWTPATFSSGAPGTTVSSYITADITGLSSGYYAVTSISLTAGTWLINYQMGAYGTGATWPINPLVGIINTGSAGALSGVYATPNANGLYNSWSGSLTYVASTTITIYLYVWTNTTGSVTIKASNSITSSPGATGIVAVRTA